MNYFNQVFDKIYVINLDNRTDRWEQCIKQFKKYNIINYERFSAIKPDLKDYEPKMYNNVKWKKYKNNKKYQIGVLGCKLSHLNIIKKAKKNKFKNVMIFEDDFLLCENFIDIFKREYEKIPPDWEMLYVGHNGYKKGLGSTHSTHAYALNNNIYDYVIKLIENNHFELDMIYFEVQLKKKCVIFNMGKPSYITQITSYSDINHTTKDRKSFKCQKFIDDFKK